MESIAAKHAPLPQRALEGDHRPHPRKGDTNAYTIEKKGSANDLPNSLAPRGRHRRRYHRTVDADSRRNAALRTGIIEHPGPEASEPLNDTRNFNRKAAKNTRNNPYPIQEKSQTTAFLPKRYEEADQNGLQHFPQPFPKTGAPAISRGRSCLFAYYRNFSNPGRYLVGSNSTIV